MQIRQESPEIRRARADGINEAGMEMLKNAGWSLLIFAIIAAMAFFGPVLTAAMTTSFLSVTGVATIAYTIGAIELFLRAVKVSKE